MAVVEQVDGAAHGNPDGAGGAERDVAAGLDQPEGEGRIDDLTQRDFDIAPGRDRVGGEGVRRVVGREVAGECEVDAPGSRGVQVLAAHALHQLDADRVGGAADRAAAGLDPGEVRDLHDGAAGGDAVQGVQRQGRPGDRGDAEDAGVAVALDADQVAGPEAGRQPTAAVAAGERVGGRPVVGEGHGAGELGGRGARRGPGRVAEAVRADDVGPQRPVPDVAAEVLNDRLAQRVVDAAAVGEDDVRAAQVADLDHRREGVVYLHIFECRGGRAGRLVEHDRRRAGGGDQYDRVQHEVEVGRVRDPHGLVAVGEVDRAAATGDLAGCPEHDLGARRDGDVADTQDARAAEVGPRGGVGDSVDRDVHGPDDAAVGPDDEFGGRAGEDGHVGVPADAAGRLRGGGVTGVAVVGHRHGPRDRLHGQRGRGGGGRPDGDLRADAAPRDALQLEEVLAAVARAAEQAVPLRQGLALEVDLVLRAAQGQAAGGGDVSSRPHDRVGRGLGDVVGDAPGPAREAAGRGAGAARLAQPGDLGDHADAAGGPDGRTVADDRVGLAEQARRGRGVGRADEAGPQGRGHRVGPQLARRRDAHVAAGRDPDADTVDLRRDLEDGEVGQADEGRGGRADVGGVGVARVDRGRGDADPDEAAPLGVGEGRHRRRGIRKDRHVPGRVDQRRADAGGDERVERGVRRRPGDAGEPERPAPRHRGRGAVGGARAERPQGRPAGAAQLVGHRRRRPDEVEAEAVRGVRRVGRGAEVDAAVQSKGVSAGGLAGRQAGDCVAGGVREAEGRPGRGDHGVGNAVAQAAQRLRHQPVPYGHAGVGLVGRQRQKHPGRGERRRGGQADLEVVQLDDVVALAAGQPPDGPAEVAGEVGDLVAGVQVARQRLGGAVAVRVGTEVNDVVVGRGVGRVAGDVIDALAVEPHRGRRVVRDPVPGGVAVGDVQGVTAGDERGGHGDGGPRRGSDGLGGGARELDRAVVDDAHVVDSAAVRCLAQAADADQPAAAVTDGVAGHERVRPAEGDHVAGLVDALGRAER